MPPRIVSRHPAAGQCGTDHEAAGGERRTPRKCASPILIPPSTSPHLSREPATARARPEWHPQDEHVGEPAHADRDAFSALYEAYADRVYRYLLSRTGNQAEAEELTSRTFLNAFAALDRYRSRGGGFSAWLMTIAHNLLVNWYRDRGRRPPTEPLEEAASVATDLPGPESSLEASELGRRVREAIGQLAPDRQRLITLKYVDGLSNAEIGRMMGRSEGAVKALHHRTLRQLRGALADSVPQ